jgi:hypothetical protein
MYICLGVICGDRSWRGDEATTDVLSVGMSFFTAMRTEFGSGREEADRSFRNVYFDKYYGCDDVKEIVTDTRKINRGKHQV